jgi:hypothetical protein
MLRGSAVIAGIGSVLDDDDDLGWIYPRIYPPIPALGPVPRPCAAARGVHIAAGAALRCWSTRRCGGARGTWRDAPGAGVVWIYSGAGHAFDRIRLP